MLIDEIDDYLMKTYSGLRPLDKWGEKSFFYNPDGLSPHGIYFLTIKQKDGENDKASQIDREGIYRINFGISEKSFLDLFSNIPARPSKGQIIKGNYNFTQLNTLLPHPVYGWMKWVSILNPNKENFEKVKLLIDESYGLAVKKSLKKNRK